MIHASICAVVLLMASTTASAFSGNNNAPRQQSPTNICDTSVTNDNQSFSTRRAFLASSAIAGLALASPPPEIAHAIGPVKIDLKNPKYKAVKCPPDRPIPGEKAMQGMQGLCVTVDVDLAESPPKDMEKVGVYGFITYGDSEESVLANNPDMSTDAGQFAMIESVTTKDKKTRFEFIAAIPKERDVSQYENGIGDLKFESLRLISFPGGQQYGAINPCEMNEFSDECEAWEKENGPYERSEYMVKSNPRTKAR